MTGQLWVRGGRRLAAGAAGALLIFSACGAAAQQPVPAGAEACAGCHADYVANYQASNHSKKADPRTPEANGGCGACHANAAEHVKAGGGKGAGGIVNPASKSLSADQKSGVCLSCHSTNRHLQFWQTGQHRKNEVSCNSCHAIHSDRMPGNDKMLRLNVPAATPYTTTVRQLAYQTCVGCHREQRAQILKPSHHPVVEGKVQCHDCHNPHGAMTPVMLRAESYQDLCLTCHTDKRGPWIHEHPPVMENCATCHTPHGSAHNRLLAQRAPALCADCHPGGHTHGIYDGRSSLPGQAANVRFEGSGCVNCHRQIHGSNAPPSAFGQFFLR